MVASKLAEIARYAFDSFHGSYVDLATFAKCCIYSDLHQLLHMFVVGEGLGSRYSNVGHIGSDFYTLIAKIVPKIQSAYRGYCNILVTDSLRGLAVSDIRLRISKRSPQLKLEGSEDR